MLDSGSRPATTQARTLVTAPSLGDQAYQVLREMITSGDLEPAEKVTERGLAGRLGVSPTPVREAISRLTHERLLVRVDGRTLHVAAPSLRRLREMVLIQASLRGVAARLAAEYASAEEIDEIERVHRASVAGSKAPGSGSAQDNAGQLRHSFHDLIVAASRNPSLIDMIETAEAFGRPLRLRAQQTAGAAASIRHALGDHEDIIAALRARDGDRAEQLMTKHRLWIGERYLEYAESVRLVVDDSVSPTV
jgi:DNA-binding GntR family transcriptional regulator